MARTQKLLIGSDHAGFALKQSVRKALSEIEWLDVGPSSAERCDYPEYAEKLAKRLVSGDAPLGILICGSGIGMSIAANKVAGVRAAVVENPVASRLAREHNSANILCLGARFVAAEYAVEIIQAWLNASPSNEGRHQARIDLITAMENSSGRGTTKSQGGKKK